MKTGWARAIPNLAVEERKDGKTATLAKYGAQHEALMAEISVHRIPKALDFSLSRSVAMPHRATSSTSPSLATLIAATARNTPIER